MIANGGITHVKGLLDLTGHDMRTMFNVNLFGVYNCHAAAERQFIEQGGGARFWVLRGMFICYSMRSFLFICFCLFST